jgi:hypothetical protein
MNLNAEKIQTAASLAGLDLELDRAALSLPALRQILDSSERLDELELHRFPLLGPLWSQEFETDDQQRHPL